MVLAHLHCPSGAPLRFAVCHTTCSSYGIRHGSSCVLHATSFISFAFSPPAANNFARLAYHRLRCGATLTQTYAHALTLTQSHKVHVTFRPFTVRPSFPTVTLLSAPASGARSRLRSALTLPQQPTLHRASLWRL